MRPLTTSGATVVNEEDGAPTDDIVQLSQVSAATPDVQAPAPTAKRKYRLFLKILQKINMVFLVVFVCYFAWTITVSYGSQGVGHTESPNASTDHNNSTIQFDDFSGFSRQENIPFFSSADDNQTDPPYNMNIIIPSHSKRGNKRRKKGRNRKRNRRLKKKYTASELEDFLNQSMESRRTNRRLCKGCEVRTRMGRNKYNTGGLKPSTLRKILERVADDTLSGVRSGAGTIHGLLDARLPRLPSPEEKSGWSTHQHWDEVGEGRTINIDDSTSETVAVDTVPNGAKTQWSTWSDCSSTCGAGQQERMRECGTSCKEVESMVCINPACEDPDDETVEAITEFYKWEPDDFVPPVQAPKHDFLDPNTDVCEEWVSCNKDFAQDFLQNSTLPACPCQYPLKRLQNKQVWDKHLDKYIAWVDASSHAELVYKPDASSCMRSQLFQGTSTLAVQQCCYDHAGILVTRGRAAGTPNLISPDISRELHYKVDLLPWIICKGDWTRYNKVLPPNNDLSCAENPDETILSEQFKDVTNY